MAQPRTTSPFLVILPNVNSSDDYKLRQNDPSSVPLAGASKNVPNKPCQNSKDKPSTLRRSKRIRKQGQSHDKLYQGLKKDHHLFLPVLSRCPRKYMLDIKKGKKKALKVSELSPLDEKKFKGMTTRVILKKWGHFIREYLPEYKGDSCPNKEFVINLVNTLLYIQPPGIAGKKSTRPSPQPNHDSLPKESSLNTPFKNENGVAGFLQKVDDSREELKKEQSPFKKAQKRAQPDIGKPTVGLCKEVQDWIVKKYKLEGKNIHFKLSALDLKTVVKDMGKDFMEIAINIYRTWTLPEQGRKMLHKISPVLSKENN